MRNQGNVGLPKQLYKLA